MNIHDPGVLEGIVGSTLGIIGGAIGVYASRRSAREPAKKPCRGLTVAQYWTVAILLTVAYIVLLLTLQSQRVINFAGLLYMLLVISLSTAPAKEGE